MSVVARSFSTLLKVLLGNNSDNFERFKIFTGSAWILTKCKGNLYQHFLII